MTTLAWTLLLVVIGVAASWYGATAEPGSPILRVWRWVKAPFSWLARSGTR